MLNHDLVLPGREHNEDAETIWCLDFTSGDRFPGIIVAQSRMREIENIIEPMKNFGHMGSEPSMAFGVTSWVDMIVRSGWCAYSSFLTGIPALSNANHVS
jgi:hypothetical protein